MREALKRHRGLTEHHQKRALDWWLYTHCDAAGTPSAMLTTRPNTIIEGTRNAEHSERDEIDSPGLYDTALNAEDGLWHRSGWAGRA